MDITEVGIKKQVHQTIQMGISMVKAIENISLNYIPQLQLN